MIRRTSLTFGFAIVLATTLPAMAEAGVNQRPAVYTVDGDVSLVADIQLGVNSSSPGGGVTLGSIHLFAANDGGRGTELWATDGTGEGTRIVKDIRMGSNGSSPQYFTKLGDVAYFVANDGINGYELWKSDGTTDGTVLVKDINQGADSSGFLNPVGFGNLLLFAGYTQANGYELWKTDGTPGGTQMVYEFEPGVPSGQPSNMTVYNGWVYFQAFTSTTGGELWRTDGTAANTTLVKDLVPGTSGPYVLNGFPEQLTVMNGKLLFSAFSGTAGRELWSSDGTAANTLPLGDFNTTPYGGQTEDFSPRSFMVLGSRAIFNGTGTGTGSELWVTDGTAAGTTLLKDLYPGDSGGYPNSSNPVGLTLIDGKVYFFAYVGATGYEPWVTDGTEAGTIPLGDLNPGAGSSRADNAGSCISCPTPQHEFSEYGDKVLFVAAGSGNGVEPWVTDGTAAGTHILYDLAVGSSSSMVGSGINYAFDNDDSRSWFAILNGRALFAANNGQTGVELWALSSSPGSPRSVTVAPSTNSVTVSWLAPTDSGASPITSYTITANPGSFTCTSTTLTCTLTGLLSNQDYTFSVVANSSTGSSRVPAISPRIRTLSPQLGSLLGSLTVVTDIVSDPALRTGDSLTVLYRGFNPNELVLLLLASNPTVIGSANADANGNVVITSVIPTGTTAGAHHLMVYAPVSGFGAAQAVTVTTSPTTGISNSSGQNDGLVVDPLTLPATGRDDSAAVWALFVLVAGLFAIRLRRHGLPVGGNRPR